MEFAAKLGRAVPGCNFGQDPLGFARDQYFQTDTASWEMKSLARPLPARPAGGRGLANRFSGKFQAVLNSVKAKSGLFFSELK